MLGEISLHHPIVVLGFGLQYISNRFAFVFSKIKDLNPIVKGKAAGKVYNAILTDHLKDRINGIAERGITLKLGNQDIKGGGCINFGAMCFFKVLLAIKLVS